MAHILKNGRTISAATIGGIVMNKEGIKKNGNVSIENLRIWKIIEDGNLDKETDGKLIMDELLDRVEYKAIFIKSEDFIKYENDKMNRELYNSLDIANTL